MSTQYRNEMAASLEALGMSVNNLIQQGFEPIGVIFDTGSDKLVI